MANDNPNPKSESTATGGRTWAQRAELFGLGALSTAAGVGLVEVGKHFIADKVAEKGVRQAAAFGRSLFRGFFGR